MKYKIIHKATYLGILFFIFTGLILGIKYTNNTGRDTLTEILVVVLIFMFGGLLLYRRE